MARQDKQQDGNPAPAGVGAGGGDERKARLGEALRANLRRRKEQFRRGGRGTPPASPAPDEPGA